LDSELKFRAIVLDNLFTVRGPLDRFDDVVKIEQTNEDGVVEVSLRGRITSLAIPNR